MGKRLYVWGSGGTGQLGLGTEDDYALPQRWSNDQVQLDLESVTSGGCHSAGISTDGRLYVWGSDERLQLGRSTLEQERNFVNVPCQPTACIPRGSKTKLVACGWWHTVVVLSADSDINSAHEVFSWGSNDYKQLGRSGDAEEKAVDMSVRITDLHLQLQVRSIACGWKHSLLATVQGEVFSWGSGRHGQLGLGNDLLQTNCPKRIDALKDTIVANVFCGWEHSVFRSVSGEVFTCGNNRHGQLGVEQTSAKEVAGVKRKQVNALPIQVMDASDDTASLRAVQLDCGWHFVLCLTDSRELVAWGKGSHGQLGLGVFENASRPQLLPFSHIVRQIACGSEHSMVVTDSGDLYTCGWGEHGNLGHGNKTNRASLEKLDFFANSNQEVLSVAAGGAVSLAVTQENARSSSK